MHFPETNYLNQFFIGILYYLWKYGVGDRHEEGIKGVEKGRSMGKNEVLKPNRCTVHCSGPFLTYIIIIYIYFFKYMYYIAELRIFYSAKFLVPLNC